MKAAFLSPLTCLAVLLAGGVCRAQVTRFERTSVYHHILVFDDGDIRTLSFNGSWETKMSLSNPLTGHFEYTEYFQMPWLWNHDIKHVLMAGLGGGSTQRAYQHFYTNVMVDTVELDPMVVQVAHDFFGVHESANLVIHTNDARVYLRRATNKWDVILMDAYATTRYGSSIPPPLTTHEFFTIANDHLTTNGVLGYNVIGQIRGNGETIIGALYNTMKATFPQVYMFPARESQNVVLVGTRNPELFDATRVQREAAFLVQSNIIKLPAFATRLESFLNTEPAAAPRSPTLTDDYAPIERLLQGRR